VVVGVEPGGEEQRRDSASEERPVIGPLQEGLSRSALVAVTLARALAGRSQRALRSRDTQREPGSRSTR
jgi:hypothetical protein